MRITVKPGGTISLWSRERRAMCERNWGESAVEGFTAITVEIYGMKGSTQHHFVWKTLLRHEILITLWEGFVLQVTERERANDRHNRDVTVAEREIVVHPYDSVVVDLQPEK